MKKNTERFSDRVENYVKYRPSYPTEIIDHLYTKTGFSKDSRIVDIGSGTGIFSRLILERGSFVTGVEPNKEMREASEKLLTEYQGFTLSSGTAEATGLPDASADFIVCAQAFHWFDREACQKEFRRILKPGGKVVLVWNKRREHKTGFPEEYETMLGTYSLDYSDVTHKQITDAALQSFFKEGVFEKAAVEYKQALDFESLRGRLLSVSYAPMPGDENHEPMMEELKRLFVKYQADGKITFEFMTEAYIGEV